MFGVAILCSCGRAVRKFRSCNGAFEPPFKGVAAFCNAKRFSASYK